MAHIVWFKRDLRLADHRPLAGAAATGRPVICLYVHEPELLESPEWDPAHSRFIEQSLAELDADLRDRGTRFTIRVGGLPEVLDRLDADLRPADGIEHLWSHEETGNRITFDRDRRVAAWCARRGIPWTEHPQHGVFRGLRSRDGWADRWSRRMREPPIDPPKSLRCVRTVAPTWRFGQHPSLTDLGLPEPEMTDTRPGGEAEAHNTLNSFLTERGVNYRADMASPITGDSGCSRLSPHLAWGTISVRTVHHALRARQAELRETPPQHRDPRWLKSLKSFQARLRWHCHFIQKLESEPAIEFDNMNRAYNGVRTEDPADWTEEKRARFDAWSEGRTGYPFIDACVRCLRTTGWMNFRMRSMLVSFASYHLWLHWRPTAIVLARRFLDFEPGIHFSQFQMQSGTTGINTVRIYNPIKQSIDQDPNGEFIRRWVPELEDVPNDAIHKPWKHFGTEPGSLFDASDVPYPPPIVDHAAAYRAAQQRIFAVRKTADARAEAKRVYLKHGSRRRPTDPPYRGGPEDRGTG